MIFKGSPFKNATIQEIATQIEAKTRCEKKLPTWYLAKNMYYPDKLNIAQTSSEITALYKSNLVAGNSLIDITGGFGVDSFYFSKKIKTVTYCELNDQLSKIVTHNLAELGINNIKIVSGDGILFLKNTSKNYDWIYLDPSRRNDSKEKVFLLEDCTPNVPENLNLLFEKSNAILLKVSPILDISRALNELKFVKEIHIVAVQNEVKEMLFLLNRNYAQRIDICTVNFNKKGTQHFNFSLDEKVSATFADPKKYLFEPNAAILKSGGFNHVSERFDIAKLHQHTHLYTSDELIEFPGRRFKITHCIPYNKKQLEKSLNTMKANIATRNFPETVSQIRKKTNIKDGGNQYLFFTTKYDNTHIVLICEQVLNSF